MINDGEGKRKRRSQHGRPPPPFVSQNPGQMGQHPLEGGVPHQPLHREPPPGRGKEVRPSHLRPRDLLQVCFVFCASAGREGELVVSAFRITPKDSTLLFRGLCCCFSCLLVSWLVEATLFPAVVFLLGVLGESRSSSCLEKKTAASKGDAPHKTQSALLGEKRMY